MSVFCLDLMSLLSVTYMTPVEHLIGDSPSQCILEVSELLDQEDKMGVDWRQLWSKLLHRSPNEAIIRQQKEGPTVFLLKSWCQIKPSAATIGELISTLNAVNRPDIAIIIEKYCQVRIFMTDYEMGKDVQRCWLFIILRVFRCMCQSCSYHQRKSLGFQSS